MNILEAVLDYASQGLKVLPLCFPNEDGKCGCGWKHKGTAIGKAPRTMHGLSDASSDPDQIREWWKQCPQANIGILTNPENGFWVLDIDAKSGGLISLAELEQEHGKLTTSKYLTGGGGYHFRYRYPQDTEIKTKKICKGIETRAGGAYIVAPPSLHVSGKRYMADGQNEIEEAPEWLIKMATEKDSGEKANFETPIEEGGRDIGFTSLAGSMRAAGANEETIYDVLVLKNNRPGQDPLTDKELRKIAKSIGSKPIQVNPTEIGNAEILISQHGNELRYDHRRRRWLRWGEHHWEVDRDGYISRLVQNIAKVRYRRAVAMKITDEDSEKRKKREFAWAILSEQRRVVSACIDLAKGMLPIADSGNNWDKDIMLLGAPNGIIDLNTGKLRDGKPKDRITRSIGTSFDPKAKCPTWLAFLKFATREDADLIEYLQRAVGYSLTGVVKALAFFFIFGPSFTGKSTFIITIRKLMGEYGWKIPAKLLMLKDKVYGGPSESLANLEGVRFAYASETEENKHLAAALLKELTSGESLTADRKYEHEGEFLPTYKIWLTSNHEPAVSDSSKGFWNRAKVIEFEAEVSGDKIDKDLGDNLEKELAGILNWAIEGCLKWQRDGLQEPKSVTDAVEQYRRDQDTIGRFIEDRCIVGPDEEAGAGSLHDSYTKWAKDEGIGKFETLKSTAFGTEIGKRYKNKHTDKGKVYYGIGIKPIVEMVNGKLHVDLSEIDG